MKTYENELSIQEIDRRVRQIRSGWDSHQRLVRRLIGDARLEDLETMLRNAESQSLKAA